MSQHLKVKRIKKRKLTSKLSDEYKCPICLEMLVRPITTGCGHNFCDECYIKFFNTTENKMCPICKNTLFRAKGFNILLDNLLRKLGGTSYIKYADKRIKKINIERVLKAYEVSDRFGKIKHAIIYSESVDSYRKDEIEYVRYKIINKRLQIVLGNKVVSPNKARQIIQEEILTPSELLILSLDLSYDRLSEEIIKAKNCYTSTNSLFETYNKLHTLPKIKNEMIKFLGDTLRSDNYIARSIISGDMDNVEDPGYVSDSEYDYEYESGDDDEDDE